MTMPIAYSPEQGCRYQILSWDFYCRTWDHLDYAKDKTERDYLLKEYRMGNGSSLRLKTILLPRKYWKE